MHGCWQECGRMSAITCSCHWHTSVVYSSSFLDLPGQPCNFFFTLNDGECKNKKKLHGHPGRSRNELLYTTQSTVWELVHGGWQKYSRLYIKRIDVV